MKFGTIESADYKPTILPGGIAEYSYNSVYKGFTIELRIPIEQLGIPIEQVKTEIKKVMEAGLDAEVSTSYLDAEVITTKDGHEYVELRYRAYWNEEDKGYSSFAALVIKAAAREITKEEYSYHINTLPLENLRRR
ncbi:MAG: hypothetical protein RXO43_02135 [Candidatus Micrarchaeota archaeon]